MLENLIKEQLLDDLLKWNREEVSALVNKKAQKALNHFMKESRAQHSLLFRGFSKNEDCYGNSIIINGEKARLSGFEREYEIPTGSVSTWTGYTDRVGNPIFWGDEVAIIQDIAILDQEKLYFFDEDEAEAEEEEEESGCGKGIKAITMTALVPKMSDEEEQPCWYWYERGGEITIYLPRFKGIEIVKRHPEDPHLWLESEDYGFDNDMLIKPEDVVVVTGLMNTKLK